MQTTNKNTILSETYVARPIEAFFSAGINRDIRESLTHLSEIHVDVDTYLEWVRAWRIMYKNISVLIREAKHVRKMDRFDTARINESYDSEQIVYNDFYPENEQFISILKKQAASLMKLRMENKEKFHAFIKPIMDKQKLSAA